MSLPADPQPDPIVLHELFARLFAANQQGLYRYILSLVVRPEDAQDVLQETSVALLRKMDRYDAEQPFLPWARQFAYYEVLKHRDRRAKAVPVLDTAVLEQVRLEAERYEPVLEARRVALDGCLGKLPKPHRELLKLRYSENTSIGDVAEMTGRPVQSLYTQLKRLRAALQECVNRRLRQEGVQ